MSAIDLSTSGHVHLLLPHGDLTLDAIALAASVMVAVSEESDLLLEEASDRNRLEDENTLHAKTIVASEMTEGETETVTSDDDQEVPPTENEVIETETAKRDEMIENVETTAKTAKNGRMAKSAKVCQKSMSKWRIPQADPCSANESPAPAAHDELDTAE